MIPFNMTSKEFKHRFVF